MSLLYSKLTKKVAQLEEDVLRVESSLIECKNGDLGVISTSLGTLKRLLMEYSTFINNQTDKEAKEKNLNRYNKLNDQYQALQQRFERSRNEREILIKQQRERERTNLFEESNDNPYQVGLRASKKSSTVATGSSDGIQMMDQQQNSLDRGNAQLDEILEMGRAAFQDIVEQNEIIAKTRETMSNSLTKLGVSRETVGKIERILWEDRIIFYAGAIVTIVIMYYIYRYLG